MTENILIKEDLDFFVQHMNDDVVPIPNMTVNKFLEITRIMYDACGSNEGLTNEKVYARYKLMGIDECAWQDWVYERYCEEKNVSPKDKMEDSAFFEWMLHKSLGYHFEELAFGYWFQYLEASEEGILWNWEADADSSYGMIDTVLAFNELVRHGYSTFLINAKEVLESALGIYSK